MTDHDVQDHLDELARDIASPVPAGLLDTARARRRRRTRGRLTVAGVAVAVLAVAVTSVAGSDPRATPQTPSSATPSDPSPVPTADATPPDPDAVRDSRLVTDRAEVVGTWTVVEVRGGPVPSDAMRDLSVTRNGARGLGLAYDDGVNGHFRNAVLTPDGVLRGGAVGSTLVGCVGPPGSCQRPSGFGVAGARQLRLTADDELVLVGPGGAALAVYRRT